MLAHWFPFRLACRKKQICFIRSSKLSSPWCRVRAMAMVSHSWTVSALPWKNSSVAEQFWEWIECWRDWARRMEVELMVPSGQEEEKQPAQLYLPGTHFPFGKTTWR